MNRVASIVLVLLSSCGDAGPHPSAVSLTLGTVDANRSGFLPLTGDQPLVAGAQGGFHVWLKYRVAGMGPGVVRARRTVRRVSDDRLILLTEGTQEIGAPGPDGTWEPDDPLPSFMCPSPIGVRVADELVRFDVIFTDPDTGETLIEAAAEATPRCPPEGDPQHDFCLEICTG